MCAHGCILLPSFNKPSKNKGCFLDRRWNTGVWAKCRDSDEDTTSASNNERACYMKWISKQILCSMGMLLGFEVWWLGAGGWRLGLVGWGLGIGDCCMGFHRGRSLCIERRISFYVDLSPLTIHRVFLSLLLLRHWI